MKKYYTICKDARQRDFLISKALVNGIKSYDNTDSVFSTAPIFMYDTKDNTYQTMTIESELYIEVTYKNMLTKLKKK